MLVTLGFWIGMNLFAPYLKYGDIAYLRYTKLIVHPSKSTKTNEGKCIEFSSLD